MNKTGKLLFLGLCTITTQVLSYRTEYVYPMAKVIIDDREHLYVVHQLSLEHLQAYLWDPQTKIARPILLSLFTPADLRVLPDQSGFSFVDKGRVRVKSNNRRSPKTIDLYQPIELNTIEWIDQNRFYFMAKEGHHFAIFQASIQGSLHRLISSDVNDCLYPQKIGESLFYLERSSEHTYTIMRAPYPSIAVSDHEEFNDLSNFDERVMEVLNDQKKRSLLGDQDKEVILSLGERSSAFLHMTSETEGFFVEHPAVVDRYESTILFTYCRVWADQKGSWHEERLFNFMLPSDFLINTHGSCLYESILPLLPRHADGHIYFVDCSQDGEFLTAHVFDFDAKNRSILRKTFGPLTPSAWGVNSSYFSPVEIDGIVYCGGTLHDHDDDAQDRGLPHMWMDENDNLCLDLPAFNDEGFYGGAFSYKE